MKTIKLIFKLLQLVKSFTLIIVLAVINGILGNLSAISISIFASLGLVNLLGYDTGIGIGWIVFIMILLGAIRGALRYFEQYSNHFIAFKILSHVRHIIFLKLRELSPAKLDTKEKGAITSQITSDVETLEVFYAHTISPILIALVVNLTVFTFISIYTSIYLGLTALLIYLIVGVILPLIFYKNNQNDGKKYREELSKFNASTLDMISGRKDILFNNEVNEFSKEGEKNTSVLQIYKNKILLKGTTSRGSIDIFIYVGAVIMILVGTLIINYNLMNPLLLLVAIITYLSSFGPVVSLANLPSNLNQTFASAKRLFDLLGEKPLVKESESDTKITFENLEVSNVTFKYVDKEILNDISFSVNKGEIVGIVGKSGEGKSTILKLIMRYYPCQGKIKINGIEIDKINKDNFHEEISMFSQATYLFNETLRENMLIAKKDATDDEIIDALKEASCYQFLENLKDGLDTVISEDSSNISLGEKQRIGLARVFLRKPKLLLLDEPTSNIDSFNESMILNSLKEHKGEMAMIMISHKKSSLSIADKIYSLKDGKLYE